MCVNCSYRVRMPWLSNVRVNWSVRTQLLSCVGAGDHRVALKFVKRIFMDAYLNFLSLARRMKMKKTTIKWRAVGGATLDEDALGCAWGHRGRHSRRRPDPHKRKRRGPHRRRRRRWRPQPTHVQRDREGVAHGAARVADSTSARTQIPSPNQCKCLAGMAAVARVRRTYRVEGGSRRSTSPRLGGSLLPRLPWSPWVASWVLDLAHAAAAAEGETRNIIVESLLPGAEDIRVLSVAECVLVVGLQPLAAQRHMLRFWLMIVALFPRNAVGAEVAL